MNGYQGRVSWSPIGASPMRDRLDRLREALGPMKDTEHTADAVCGFMQMSESESVFVVWSSTNEISAKMMSGSIIRDVPDAVIERISRFVLSFARGYTLTASRT